MTKEQHITLGVALCGHIPYGVKFKYFCPYNHENDRIGTIDGIDSLPNLHFFDENGSRVQIGKTCMPILHPLSDLTQPITHNGDTFTPIVKAMEYYWGDDREVKYEAPMPNDYVKAFLDGEEDSELWVHYCEMHECPAWLTGKLTEWMFDTNNLISQSLALSIHDLPENPYL